MNAQPDQDEFEVKRSWRWYQKPVVKYMLTGGKRAISICHRRWGKDEVALGITCNLLHQRIANYAHCLPEYAQAKKAIWKSVNPHTGKRRIDEAFPRELRKSTNESEMLIEFNCGSTWQVLGSDSYDRLVGSAWAGVVFSEWPLCDPAAYGYIQPILVENDGWAMFNGTPRGDNHAKSMYDAAVDDPAWFAEISAVSDTRQIPHDRLVAARNELIALFGKDVGNAQYEQEFECSFDAAILGAFYGMEMSDALKTGRISGYVPHLPDLPVHRAWDLGMSDSTAIWWFQLAGGEIRVLDYYSAHSQGLLHYAKVIEEKQEQHGYKDGWDIVPQDAKVRELGTGKTRIETMQQLGLNPHLCPSHKLLDGINAARLTISRCWFHSERCKEGINALKQYKREWDQSIRQFKKTPKHDWTSHPADAFRYLSMGHRDLPHPEIKKPADMRTIKEMSLDELIAAEQTGVENKRI